MQAEVMYRKPLSSAMTTTNRQEISPVANQQDGFRIQRASRPPRTMVPGSKDSRETIHSGHFMVSDFEAEAQDDEDELAVPVPEEEAARMAIIAPTRSLDLAIGARNNEKTSSQQLSIETSLNKLFQCMSLAYRQKLTSPKWNRFKGIRLRWKDKIRLNNVIWRCWHMQFILKQNTLVCQFASPLDVDTHNKPEAVVLEGKYWKRKLAAVTAEYKKWRMFYRNKILGWTPKDGQEMLESMDMLEWGDAAGGAGNYNTGCGNSYGGSAGTPGGDSMMVDEDYMELMTDTLFSTISSNQPIYFPDPREIARGASLADFIQPSLGPLQPNLDDFMDTLEPLQEFLNSKLPAVPEEEDMFRGGTLNQTYPELDIMAPMQQMNELGEDTLSKTSEQTQQNQQPSAPMQDIEYNEKMFGQTETETASTFATNANLGESYSAIRGNFQAQGTTQTVVEKTRPSRSSTRTNRVLQQRQQQANTYSTSFTQQQSYAMEIQSSTVEMPSIQSQQVPTLAEQQSNGQSNQLNPMSTQLQNLVSLPTNFTQIQQKPVVRQTPQNATVLAGKPFKIVQPQQGYKFSQNQSFASQQCKFNANSFKGLPGQQVVETQPTQQIVLQCRPGVEVSSTKLQPDKEEVFAVPKYQMKQRNRSRSSCSVSTARMHPPPLVSTVSDPALNLNNNVLLAHLLTNNTTGIYAMSTSSEKIVQSPSQQQGNVKHMLPMLPPSTTAPGHHLPTPVANLQQTSTVHGQSQVMLQAQGYKVSCSQTMMLNQSTGQTHQSQGSPGSPKGANSPQGLNLSPMHSPLSIGSPLSPGRAFVKAEAERGQYKEQRRVGHIHAEQKRRYNIKNGFDMLHSLIPQLSQNPNTKLSKAAMLQKGADYIRQLRAERNQLKEEMDSLRHQIECLNTSISNCQSMLPATGAPVSRHRTSKMKEMFDEYVRARTQENWKFWIFSILLEPLMVSFNSSVSTASIEDLYRSTILWVEQHCSLVDLRPAVLNSLRYLSTTTDILSDPARLPEEALSAVNRKERRRSTQ